MSAPELKNAKKIVAHVAAQRKRWGLLSGFGEYSQEEVLDALMAIHNANILDIDGDDLREQVTKANRAKGAAVSRELRQKQISDELRAEVNDLRKDNAEMLAQIDALEEDLRKWKP